MPKLEPYSRKLSYSYQLGVETIRLRRRQR